MKESVLYFPTSVCVKTITKKLKASCTECGKIPARVRLEVTVRGDYFPRKVILCARCGRKSLDKYKRNMEEARKHLLTGGFFLFL